MHTRQEHFSSAAQMTQAIFVKMDPIAQLHREASTVLKLKEQILSSDNLFLQCTRSKNTIKQIVYRFSICKSYEHSKVFTEYADHVNRVRERNIGVSKNLWQPSRPFQHLMSSLQPASAWIEQSNPSLHFAARAASIELDGLRDKADRSLLRLPPASDLALVSSPSVRSSRSGSLSKASSERPYDRDSLIHRPSQYCDDAADEFNETAYLLLYRFERDFRNWLASQMHATFGTGWMDQRVPNKIRRFWRKRLDEDRRAQRQPQELIHYASFSDYASIILNEDNWNDVFWRFFPAHGEAREVLDRLRRDRNAVMHGRIVSEDDLIRIRVDLRWLGRILARTPPPAPGGLLPRDRRTASR